MPESEDVADDLAESAPLRLSSVARSGIAVFGVGSILAGALAVFNTTNQAGTAALIVLGGFFILLALVGRLPERGAVGSANWEYRPLRRLLKSDNPEVREAAADEVLSSPGAVGSAQVRFEARAVMQESARIDSLAVLLRVNYPQHAVRREAVIGADQVLRPDLILESAFGTDPEWAFPIELATESSKSVLARVHRYAEALGSRVAVLAVSQGLPEGEVMRAEVGGVTVFVVRYIWNRNQSSIKHAIDQAIDASVT